VVLNDCSRPSHLGTRLVIEGLRAAAARAGIVVQRTYPLGYDQWDARFDRELDGVDVVLLNGEGTCHHDAPNAFRMFAGAARAKASGKPVALINSVWEANPSLERQLQHVDLVFVRESRSAEAVGRAGIRASVVPDLSLSAPVPIGTLTAEGPPVVFDSVVDSVALALAAFAAQSGYPFFPMRDWFGGLTFRQPWLGLRAAIANRSLMRPFGLAGLPALRRAPMVVTGRYHGACLAILLHKPFLALSSNSHKTAGLCEEAGIPDALVDRSDRIAPRAAELLTSAEELAAMASALSKYGQAAVAAHDQMFASIARLA
jgi:hypothetical protein